MTASAKLVVVMAAGLLPWGLEPAAPQEAGQRQVFQLAPGRASRPAEVRMWLQWDGAHQRLVRQCGGLDAETDAQLWLLATKAQRERPEAALVLALDPAVALADLLAVLREAPPGLRYEVAGAGSWQRVAPAAAPVAATRPASVPADPEPGREVEMVALHSHALPPCDTPAARDACRDPVHWCLTIRGKKLSDKRILVERLIWEAAQRGPAGPDAFATHRVLLRCPGEAPCAVLLLLAEVSVETGFRGLEIQEVR